MQFLARDLIVYGALIRGQFQRDLADGVTDTFAARYRLDQSNYGFTNFARPLMNICTASMTSNIPINRSIAINPLSFNSR